MHADKPEHSPEYLSSLNPNQRKAVEHTEGPLLIIAGAGAGKTRVIVHRILHLIHKGVDPKNILAVTFTNKASREMRDRISSLISSDASLNFPIAENSLPFVSTFHTLGVRLLRENSIQAGVSRRFSIYDRTDSIRALKEAMKLRGVDPKQFEPRKILGTISKQKGTGTSATAYMEDVGNDFYKRLVGDVWSAYERILTEEKALDFDDLLLKTVTLLQNHENVRKHYQERFQYIHVDEYQDTNKIQYVILDILAGLHKKICVVGDHDQNVYSWRGSSLENILDFEQRFPDARTVVLEQNYRSTKTIIAVSNDIISKNMRRKEKNLFTENEDGEKIALFSAYNEEDEASFIAETAQALVKNGAKEKDIAVLYRANFQSRVLEEAFLHAGIPYRVLGTKFFERKEVKDTLAYLSLAFSPENATHISRVINTPPRGIGKVTLLKVLANKENTLPAKTLGKVRQFHTLIANIRSTAETKRPSETIRMIIEQSGMLAHYGKGSEDDVERIENLKELVTLAKKYDTLPPEEGVEALLDSVALTSEQDNIPDSTSSTDTDTGSGEVTLMTVHASKGLEFQFVFITGMEEGLFPHERLSSDEVDEEEERRLFYVALTRAKEKVYLSYASMRTVFGSKKLNIPSEFLTDIDNAFLEEATRERGEKVIYLDLE
jgi:DNA helicase II / ATP-dependent DNA helicase PcrA